MHVSRPLIGLLVATVAFFAVWTLALKGSSSPSSSGGGASTNAYQSAISQAHQAVANSAGVNARDGGTVTSATATTTAATGVATTAHATTTAHASVTTTTHAAAVGSTHGATVTHSATIKSSATPAAREAAVTHALSVHKVVAILFYNPAATDDQAVKTELANVPTHGGRVFKLAVPLSELSHYPVVTNQVPITGSPTLVLIDTKRSATSIVGFTDRFEISRHVAAVVSVK